MDRHDECITTSELLASLTVILGAPRSQAIRWREAKISAEMLRDLLSVKEPRAGASSGERSRIAAERAEISRKIADREALAKEIEDGYLALYMPTALSLLKIAEEKRVEIRDASRDQIT